MSKMRTIMSKMRDADMPLLERIEAAIRRITNGDGTMRVPVEATDPDIVLHDCKQEIERLRAAIDATPSVPDANDIEWAGKAHLTDAEAMIDRLTRERDEHARWRAELADKLHATESLVSELRAERDAMAKAAIRYDEAIQQCANDPELMSSYCTAQGDTLDTLYDDWISKARASLAQIEQEKANGTR